jgi:hypothetical protein
MDLGLRKQPDPYWKTGQRGALITFRLFDGCDKMEEKYSRSEENFNLHSFYVQYLC